MAFKYKNRQCITAAKIHWGRRLDKILFCILATFYRGTTTLLRTPQRFLAANVSVHCGEIKIVNQ